MAVKKGTRIVCRLVDISSVVARSLREDPTSCFRNPLASTVRFCRTGSMCCDDVKIHIDGKGVEMEARRSDHARNHMNTYLANLPNISHSRTIHCSATSYISSKNKKGRVGLDKRFCVGQPRTRRRTSVPRTRVCKMSLKS